MASSFCDHLVKRFWANAEFNLSWWEFESLEDPPQARQAAQRAVEADFVVIATRRESQLSQTVLAWFEYWVERRSDREGSLVGLMDPGNVPHGGAVDKYVYLRNLAHRAGLDYLTEVPQDLARSIPDSIESCAERAGRVTSVLDQILKTQMPPPHLAQ